MFSLFQKQWRSLFIVVTALILMLMVRLQTTITPQFSTADNPAAKESAFLTRLLTFSHLPVHNFWLLLCPNWLSFDWGMEAIPRISAISDRRNVVSLIFYALSTRLIVKCVRVVRQYKKTLKTKSLYENNGSLLSSSSVRVREKGDKSCPCSVCHVNFLDLHSLSCRNTNNNNSMNAYSTCVCSLSLKRATIHRNRKMLSSSCAILLSFAFLILPFLPATNILFYVGFVVAERVLYLPSAGLCLLIGLAGAKFWNYRQFRTSIVLCLFVLLCAFSARTLHRNKDWYNEESLYRSAIPINPPKGKEQSLLYTFLFLSSHRRFPTRFPIWREGEKMQFTRLQTFNYIQQSLRNIYFLLPPVLPAGIGRGSFMLIKCVAFPLNFPQKKRTRMHAILILMWQKKNKKWFMKMPLLLSLYTIHTDIVIAFFVQHMETWAAC